MRVTVADAEDGTSIVTITEIPRTEVNRLALCEAPTVEGFLFANVDDPDVWEAVRAVLAGESRSIMLGGGASPMVTIGSDGRP